DGLQGVKDTGRDDSLAGSPLEHATDAGDGRVDLVPAPAQVDHPLSHGLQILRAELRGGSVVVQLAERPDGVLEVLQLARRPALPRPCCRAPVTGLPGAGGTRPVPRRPGRPRPPRLPGPAARTPGAWPVDVRTRLWIPANRRGRAACRGGRRRRSARS